MNMHDEARVCIYRAAIVFEVSAIGGPYFNHAGSRTRHHIRHTEVAADLNKFAARHDRLTVAGEHGQHKKSRGGAVVYDQCIFRSCQILQQRLDSRASFTARTTRYVVLERAKTTGLDHRLARSGRQRRTAQVCVQQHTGRVDYSRDACLTLDLRSFAEPYDCFRKQRLRRIAIRYYFSPTANRGAKL